MTIAAILANRRGGVITTTADTSVSDIVAVLAERRIGAVPVVDGDTVLGILSERDVIYRLATDGASVLGLPASQVMTAPAITVDPSQPVLTALGLMTRRRIRHLPVVVGGKLAGLVSIGDLVKYRMDKIEQEAKAMRDYIQSA